ncbi:MAG: hypothetical protein ABI337_08910 [Nitrososphaera sp.]|jgi:putative transposase
MKLMDRDIVASMNVAYKGWSRFCHPRGLPIEAMRGNVGLFEPLIFKADGSKLVVGWHPMVNIVGQHQQNHRTEIS